MKIYLVIHTINGKGPKIAQVEAENITEAIEKTKKLFSELTEVGGRKYELIDIEPLTNIRKLDL